MTETMDLYTVPKVNGEAPLPRRAGTLTMLPSTWISRGVRLEYVGAGGQMQQTSATLLDWCGMGPVFNIGGARTVAVGSAGGLVIAPSLLPPPTTGGRVAVNGPMPRN